MIQIEIELLDKLLYQIGFFVAFAQSTKGRESTRIMLGEGLGQQHHELLKLSDVVLLGVVLYVQRRNVVVHLI